MRRERNPMLSLAALLLALAAAVVFTACSSRSGSAKSPAPFNPYAFTNQEAFGGQMVMDTLSRTDTVVSIDSALRRIELKHADGTVTSYKCGPEIRNFDQMKVGDQVKATVVDEVAVYFKPASQSQSLAAASLTVGARLGAKPGVVNLDTFDFTARIAAIDPWKHQVTLLTADGRSRPITVSEYINLADFNVGDEVAVRLTQALAILVENP
ncbi:MAG TPA: hypothetical protein VMB80_18250 [Candidatus Acidoferrum sp.]|nr:hypothetical protein [Candidatus Acidoferrum sp.]